MKRLLIGSLLLAWSCTNEDGAAKALRVSGFTNVTLTGYDWYGCGKDATCTGFEATAPNGERVTGAVGCGHSWSCGKACTVRVSQ